MIGIQASRVKSGEHFDQGVRSVSVGRATESLLRFELGFGGVVSKFSEFEIVVVTHVLGCVDTTVFSGSSSEMKTLLVGAALYSQFRGERFDVDVDKLIKSTRGSPLLITAWGGLVFRNSFLVFRIAGLLRCIWR